MALRHPALPHCTHLHHARQGKPTPPIITELIYPGPAVASLSIQTAQLILQLSPISLFVLEQKKLLMVASLAYSADWLAYEVRKLG